MSITQTDFPTLATILPLAGRVWQVEIVGDFEYGELTVQVSLSSGSQKAGPFQFGGEEFLEREELPFTAEQTKSLEDVVYDLMSTHWPIDF